MNVEIKGHGAYRWVCCSDCGRVTRNGENYMRLAAASRLAALHETHHARCTSRRCLEVSR